MSVGKTTVAVVDDDEAVLDATSGFLESLGYDTVAFNSGTAFLASEVFLASGATGRVACLLTDVDMPGLNGLELQERVRRVRPTLPIIMMTALSDDSLRRRALAGGARDLLRKPLAADDLIRCLEGTVGS
ncbi:response regulator transcription factor [Methylobacterium frigidaeris]|uniref:Response regulator protein TmoT n=1 Tax=Methylobacterium frigidaeris TaxID=2038277 RepID=A0AA37HHV0_9HYPH|nr:response regulator [Methylobacterium frigidaeris]GJD65854.1 Response regulator protein TmoT [Methylobacterium frigidaeris]